MTVQSFCIAFFQQIALIYKINLNRGIADPKVKHDAYPFLPYSVQEFLSGRVDPCGVFLMVKPPHYNFDVLEVMVIKKK